MSKLIEDMTSEELRTLSLLGGEPEILTPEEEQERLQALQDLENEFHS